MYKHNYRYSLGKLTGRCPSCHHRTFKYYIDNTTGDMLDPECGRCNREVKCGYHLVPKQFFKEKGNGMVISACRRLPVQRPATVPPSFIEEGIAGKGFGHIKRSNLFNYITRLFPVETALRHFRLMDVGHSRFCGNATVFWQRDRMGRLRSGKVMAYDAYTGHRLKNQGRPAVAYAHTLLGYRDFHYTGCFFGEYLASQRPDDTLLVVESEKTALLLNMALGCMGITGSTAIATGGASLLSIDDGDMLDPYFRGSILSGRRVVLLPDADMVGHWQSMAMRYVRYTDSIEVIDTRRPPYSLEGSDDIGDLIVRRCIFMGLFDPEFREVLSSVI